VNRRQYYDNLKVIARQVRTHYGLSTPRVRRSDLRRVFRGEGIQFDLWPYRLKELRGAYFDDDLGPTIFVSAKLPPEPRIFTMAHELKHHLVDRGHGQSFCATSNEKEQVEIGAEIFAAEFIFPEADFIQAMMKMGIKTNQCVPETLVRLKHSTGATLSYAALTKLAVYLKYALPENFRGVRWRRLEESVFGRLLDLQIEF
jgi:Zn-dependent peptidase ImmA (M78 family)